MGWNHQLGKMLNQKLEVWKAIFISNYVMFRFHVNFPWCKGFNEMDFKQRSSSEWNAMEVVGIIPLP